jgi:hypothetical protein
MKGRSRRPGQALVEFALVAPIFFLLLFSIIEAGRFIFHYEMLSNAARDGARYAIVHGSNSSCPSGPMPGGVANPCDLAGDNVKDAVRDAAISLVATGEFDVLDPVWDPNNQRGSRVTVSVSYGYNSLLPLLPTITIAAESTLVINN